MFVDVASMPCAYVGCAHAPAVRSLLPCPNAHSVFPCATPAEVRALLPAKQDVVVFQCRNPVHRAHYELFTRALHAPNVRPGAVCLVHPTCGPTQVRAAARRGATEPGACGYVWGFMSAAPRAFLDALLPPASELGHGFGAGRRHPRHRPLPHLRGAEGGAQQPQHQVGLPALLHAHGRPP